MRDYRRFNICLNLLTGDVYAQPPDKGHTAWAMHALSWIATTIYAEAMPTGSAPSVLDVGCGQGFLCPIFEDMGLDWTGLAIGEDAEVARENLQKWGKDSSKVYDTDMAFLPFEDNQFDLIFARHVLEHSPFPVIALMELRRVVKEHGYLCLIAPAPHYWGYHGKNHYSIAPMPLLKWWTERAGWHLLHEFTFTNRDPLFLKYLTPYQNAPKSDRENILESYPEGPVEFRLICEAGEEIVE